MNKYFTQIRETEDMNFLIVAGENPDHLEEVGREKTYAKAQTYRAWWVDSMGYRERHVNHGFVPVVPMQGKIAGH